MFNVTSSPCFVLAFMYIRQQMHAIEVYHHHHHHHVSVMGLGHFLTRSGLTYPEVSSKVYHDSFCQLGSSVTLPWVIYFEAFVEVYVIHKV